LFEFIVAGVHQVHVQLGGEQIITQRFGHTARIAGLRGGDKRNAGISAAGAGAAAATRLLIQHSPEIAGDPGKLSGSEISGGSLKARQLLRVQRKQSGRWGLCCHASLCSSSKAEFMQ
jgi:hypothetical protein